MSIVADRPQRPIQSSIKREPIVKHIQLIPAFCALFIGASSVPATAQTCVSPILWPPAPAGGSIETHTTCGGDVTATSYCAGNQSAPGPAVVFHTVFASARTFTEISLSGGSSGLDPVMYMSAFADGCGTNAACGRSGDNAFPMSDADIPDGDWYLIVTAAGIDSAGACGFFGLSTNGSFPVVLQEFTIT